jgi:PPOX class probable F420-dependent enzyme
MATLNQAARELIASGALGHLVTIDPDGSPQVTLVWVGLDGDGLVTAHLMANLRKLANIRRDPRVALSFEGTRSNPIGLREYLVVHGEATISEGGAADLLHRLAQTYIGPGARFPPMPNPPAGYVVHIAVTRVGGIGPWAG